MKAPKKLFIMEDEFEEDAALHPMEMMDVTSIWGEGTVYEYVLERVGTVKNKKFVANKKEKGSV